MSSDVFKEQAFAVRVLARHLEKKRLAHTYLVTGKRASGKEMLAGAFARALNCERSVSFQDCDCLSCRKTRDGNHPDVMWVAPDPKARSIKIGEVRQIIQKAGLKPYEGRWKVFILPGAERLTVEASNALLKTLEEPPERTIFLLLVESKAHLLETIQSRAFEIPLKPLESGHEEMPKEEKLAELGRKPWPDFFEGLQTLPREELTRMLDRLMEAFRDRAEAAAGGRSPVALAAWLEAVDRVREVKTAVEENANQKLAMTRAAVRLKRIFPDEKVCV